MRAITLIAILLGFLISCDQPREFELKKVLTELPIIPKPVAVSNDSSYHVLGTLIVNSENDLNLSTTGVLATWKKYQKAEESSNLNFIADSTFSPEQYLLHIDDFDINITARDQVGFYWGLISLQQVLQFGLDSTAYGLAIPTGTIKDQPAYGYRGMMLDIARHFFNTDEIKQLIDEITLYKINYLHLHLSDDQGWRIEIKSWPKLTEIGGKTEVGSTPGGYLTQEDYEEIVSYASQRNITIVPEIDMPGHTNAALASYPELNCDGVARKPYTGMRVGFSSLCVDKELTYKFVSDVVSEISALTPGPYFHIGGDESHATEHDDYLYFVNQVRQIVNDQGKIMIGWDEIAEADINEKSVVQFWRHEDKAMKGLEKAASIIFSPAHKAYLDMKYDSTTTLGLTWAGRIDLPTAYNWDLTEFISKDFQDQFLGIEAPLWSETVTNINEVEYMVFPRLTAYAEIGWTPEEERGFNDYLYRLKRHQQWWKHLEIDAHAGSIKGLVNIKKFNFDKDLLLAHYDFKTDIDDLHSVAALATLLKNPEFAAVNYHAVAGTYGIQDGLYVPPNELMKMAFGNNWIDAHNNKETAIEEVKKKALQSLDQGGNIWIAEGGQSDFSAALIRAVQSERPAIKTTDRINIVQHANWNEEVTDAEELAFVRSNTDYRKIPDGNAEGNGTPGFRSDRLIDLEKHIQGESLLGIWGLAKQLGNEYNGKDERYLNESVQAGGLDFSDFAEVCWILNLEGMEDSEDFFLRYAKGE